MAATTKYPETLPREMIFSVPGVSCSHCESAIATRVTVSGGRLDPSAVREAIEQAGYDVEP